MCYAEAASPRITETSICAAQQLFNSSCWAVSRFSSGGILASAASKVPPTDCLGAKILPQNPQNSQKLLLGIFSHRLHRSAQIVWVRRFSHRLHGSAQIVWVRRFSHRFHRSAQIVWVPSRGCTCLKCTNIARGAPTEQEVHQRSQVGCVSKLASSTPRRGRST